MTAGQGIETLEELTHDLQASCQVLQAQVNDVKGQWARLKKLGAARDDHASQLLTVIDSALRIVERAAQSAKDRVQIVIANPFGD